MMIDPNDAKLVADAVTTGLNKVEATLGVIAFWLFFIALNSCSK